LFRGGDVWSITGRQGEQYKDRARLVSTPGSWLYLIDSKRLRLVRRSPSQHASNPTDRASGSGQWGKMG